MKCRKKKGYDCFYLTKDNTNEFLKWINNLDLKQKYNYMEDCDTYLFVATEKLGEDYDYMSLLLSSINDENHYYNHEFWYDYWHVFRDGSFYMYSDEMFKSVYDLVDDKEM